MDVRIVGHFTTKSPLSHIGESASTTTFLVQEPILQPEGHVERVFVYSGNAWRGQLRDLAARYMLDKLGSPTINTDAFHLLFSGGRIGGEQKVNIANAREFRRLVPLLVLFGGGVGNQILPGKLQVRNNYPVRIEARPVLTITPEDQVKATYADLTMEKSFTRMDDAKDERLNHHLLPAVAVPEQASLLDAGDPAPKSSKTKNDNEPATQMRMTSELLIAGVRLETVIDAIGVNEVELGCLVSALDGFAHRPYIGGQANRGHGLVDLDYSIVDIDTGETHDFASIRGGMLSLAERAQSAKDAYDRHLLDAYERMLDEARGPIIKMLKAG